MNQPFLFWLIPETPTHENIDWVLRMLVPYEGKFIWLDQVEAMTPGEILSLVHKRIVEGTDTSFHIAEQ